MIKTKLNNSRGFTLIEMLVSVSLFSMVMLMATGSVFTVVEANKKSQSLKSVMTNLNFALESMSRDIRTGFRYVCGIGGDCVSGASTFRFKANRDVDGNSLYNATDSNDQIEYRLSGGRIIKRIYGGSSPEFPITAEEIEITSLRFYVVGTAVGDGLQPKVVISIEGYSGSDQTRSRFNIQTTVSQRRIDS